MKKFSILCIVVSFFCLLLISKVRAENPTKIMRTRFHPTQSWIQYISSLDLLIIKPNKWKHLFINSGSTVKNIFDQHKAKAVINWSYFRKDGEGTFYQAWASFKNWKTIAKSSFCDDPNICALFNTDTMDIKPIVYSGEYDGSRRSAGPMLLQSWTINIQIKKKFSHRSSKTKRTVLVFPWPYFVYTQKDYTLFELAKILKKLFPTSTVVNLDWWSSTSFYNNSYQFNSKKLLPEFFVLY